MKLDKIALINFKNYSDLTLEFSEDVNCIVGKNGVGKTNVIDAIYYLSFCKSFFNSIDSQNIKHDLDFFSIQGTYKRKEKVEKIFCGLKRKHKKQFKRNKKEYTRLADHIGLFPLVIISPTDSELINQGSDVRRKFLDSIISQFNKTYLDNLLNYNKALAHRNALLKQFYQTGNFSSASLEIWDDQLIQYGEQIYKERESFIKEFTPYFEKYYHLIGVDSENISLEYTSQLHIDSFNDLLNSHQKKDRSFQHTTAGIHKDELLFKINDFPVKKFASQGQQKTFVLALKLGQAEYMKQQNNLPAIILLDDIYDKLDAQRVAKLAEIVCTDNFGQVFITDAHPDRSYGLFKDLKADVRLFEISQEGVTNETKTGRTALKEVD